MSRIFMSSEWTVVKTFVAPCTTISLVFKKASTLTTIRNFHYKDQVRKLAGVFGYDVVHNLTQILQNIVFFYCWNKVHVIDWLRRIWANLGWNTWLILKDAWQGITNKVCEKSCFDWQEQCWRHSYFLELRRANILQTHKRYTKVVFLWTGTVLTPFLFSGMASGVHQATKTGSSLLQSGSSPWKWPRTKITFWSPNLKN